jgi:hypothetical protein
MRLLSVVTLLFSLSVTAAAHADIIFEPVKPAPSPQPTATPSPRPKPTSSPAPGKAGDAGKGFADLRAQQQYQLLVLGAGALLLTTAALKRKPR